MPDIRDGVRFAFDHDYAATTIILARLSLKEDSRDWLVWHWYGTMLYQMARYDEAVSALEKAIEYAPKQSLDYLYSRMGHLYRYKGDYQLAEKWYQKVIDAKPNDATGYIYLGAAMARQGKLRDAEAAHRAGTCCQEGCLDEAFHNLGLILRGQERLREAKECFEKAVEIDPEYADALEALEDVRQALRLCEDEPAEPSATADRPCE